MGKRKTKISAVSKQLRFDGCEVVFAGKSRWKSSDLKLMVRQEGGTVAQKVTDSTGVLVLLERGPHKAAENAAAKYNAQGAEIFTISETEFFERFKPSTEEVLQLLQAGTPGTDRLRALIRSSIHKYVEGIFDLGGANLRGKDLRDLSLRLMNLKGADLRDCQVDEAYAPYLIDVRLSGASGKEFSAQGMINCQCTGADLPKFDPGMARDCDFSRSKLPEFELRYDCGVERCRFRNCLLTNATFDTIAFVDADFQGADLSHATLKSCECEGALLLSKANLSGATLTDCNLYHCDLTQANLRGAKLESVDLEGAKLNKANLTGAELLLVNLSNTNLTGADFKDTLLLGVRFDGANLKRAKNLQVPSLGDGKVGSACAALDAATKNAEDVTIQFSVTTPEGEVAISCANGKSARRPAQLDFARSSGTQPAVERTVPIESLSHGLRLCAETWGTGNWQLDGLQVSTYKSKVTKGDWKQLAEAAVRELLGQDVPRLGKIALRKIPRHRTKAQRTAPTGVADFASFLQRFEKTIEKQRLTKALKMLKADRFELFSDVTAESVVGVVKSQTDSRLVYSCRLTSSGNFCCCTQNLNHCGGLRGALCKHLLVLIVGLAKAERIDPQDAAEWAYASASKSPILDQDAMSETLLKYKGMEAGDIDWRPTETLPEDYYAF